MVSSIYNKLTPYTNSKHTIVHDQQVSDIISAMIDAHVKYAPEYNKIAPYFAGRDAKTTARNIYNFLKNNVNYVVEDDDNQMIKSPSAILYTGKTTGSDCKNYSLFGAGVLDALNRMGFPINWTYRFASYKMFDKMPHHVFVVINPDTNHEIWVDPVLNGFDYKKQYYYKLDKKPKIMSLIALSGIGAKKKASPKKVAKKQAKTVKKTVRTAKRKEAIKKIATKLKTTGKGLVKIAATPVRNAFLLLVKTNYKGLATALNQMYKTKPDALKTFWEGQKGTWSSLVNNINTGLNTAQLSGVGKLDLRKYANKIPAVALAKKLKDKHFENYIPQVALAKYIHKKHIEHKRKRMGFVSPATVIEAGKKAAIITASPILLKALKFLKENGINLGDDFTQMAQDQVNNLSQNAVQDVVNEAKQITTEEKQQTAQDESDAGITPTEETASSNTGMGKNTLLLVGAGAVGLFLLTRKK
jgi:hypothetical protein